MASGVQSFYRYFPVSERDRNWGFFILTAGESAIPPGALYPPAGHPHGYEFNWDNGRILHEYQLVYIARGRGWFECESQRRRIVEAGSVILVFPNVWHRYRPDEEVGWKELWVGFDGDTPRRLARHGFFSPKRPIIRPRHEELFLELFSSLVGAMKANQPALQQVMAGITNYLLSLLYSTEQTAPESPGASLAITEALRLMNADLRAPIHLEQLAERLHVSCRWLRRSFAQHTGMSPYQYLLQLRIARARALLAETNLTVKEIAAQTGFVEEQYFCRLFKKKNGIAPGQWRLRSRG